MLYIKLKKIILLALVAFIVSSIIFAVSGFGIIAIAVGGFFGNFNWKWLGAIIIGLMVIALTSGIIQYMVGADVLNVTDTLK